MTLKILNPTIFPVRIRIASDMLDDFRECELGSYEDYEGLMQGDAEDQQEARDGLYGTTHVYEILGRALDRSRRLNTIELRDENEAAEVYYAVCSGTFQLSPRGLRAARRLADQLRPVLQEPQWEERFSTLLAQWPRPEGV